MKALNLTKRMEALEERSGHGTGKWHRLVWRFGQGWADVLADYGEDKIKPGDHILLINFVKCAAAGGPEYDPAYVRDKPIADAWLAAHDARRTGDGLTVVLNKPG